MKPGIVILRRPEVLRRVGMGRSQLDVAMEAGIFPASIPILPGGRAVGWAEHEVDTYLASRIAVRDADLATGRSRQPAWLIEAAAKAKPRPSPRKAAAKRQRRKATASGR